jgi:hypothetical protein
MSHHCMMRRLVIGLECCTGAVGPISFLPRLSTPNGTLTILFIPSLHNWKKMKLTTPTFSRVVLQFIQRTSMALLDDVFADWIISTNIWPPRSQYLSPANFFSGVRWKWMIWRWPSQNTFKMWTVLYWARSSRTQFGVSINVLRLSGDTCLKHEGMLMNMSSCVRQLLFSNNSSHVTYNRVYNYKIVQVLVCSRDSLCITCGAA